MFGKKGKGDITYIIGRCWKHPATSILCMRSKVQRCCEEKTKGEDAAKKKQGGRGAGSPDLRKQGGKPGSQGGRGVGGRGPQKRPPPGEWNRIQSNSTLPHASIKSHKNRLSIIFWRCVVIFIKLNAVEDQLQSSIDLYYKASFVARCEIEI
jgi:hypothetical protein